MEGTTRRRRSWAAYALAALLLSLLAGGAGAAIALRYFDDDAGAVAVGGGSVAERVVAAGLPSLVTIVVTQRPHLEDGETVQDINLGSGIIIDGRGFVVTNEHVVRDAARITVTLADGREVRGTLVSDDRPFTDLAVVRLEGTGPFPALSLGDSDALQLGQTLVMIGNSLKYFPASVTTGVVSGLHRDWSQDNIVMEDMLQTDAPVNHGNSGGALLTERGDLVGLVTKVVDQTELGQPVQGIALAISSRTIRDVAEAMIERGSKPRPTLGVEHADVSPKLAAANGFLPVQAAFVRTVASGSPAERGGLRPDDLILSMGGITLTEERPYNNVLMRLPIGRAVALEVVRGRARITVTVIPEAR